MKYETPELTALTPAISAIQGQSSLNAKNRLILSPDRPLPVGFTVNEHFSAYADWE